jgi:hypothetical protein
MISCVVRTAAAARNKTCPAWPFRVFLSFVFIPRSVPISPTASPAERFAHIIGMLCDAITARGPGGVLPTPLLLLLWGRLRRMATRMTRAAARLAAGIPPPAPRPRPASPRPSRPQPLRLPRRFAWVVVEVPGSAVYGHYLQALLADPKMAPLAAVPSVRRMLNPLCQMLGVPARASRPRRAPRRPAAVLPPPPRDRLGDRPAANAPPPQATPVAA